jgi:hypothetical protein
VLRSLLYYEPGRAALWPAGVLGVTHVLISALLANDTVDSFPGILVSSMIGYIGGVCNLFLIAFGMSVVSSWFKEYGLFDQIKQVVSWSCFPLIIGAPIFLIISIPLQIMLPDATPPAGVVLGATYLLLGGLWGMHIQWSGISILFKGEKISPIWIIILPYLLLASFVFLAQQVYVIFH